MSHRSFRKVNLRYAAASSTSSQQVARCRFGLICSTMKLNQLKRSNRIHSALCIRLTNYRFCLRASFRRTRQDVRCSDSAFAKHSRVIRRNPLLTRTYQTVFFRAVLSTTYRSFSMQRKRYSIMRLRTQCSRCSATYTPCSPTLSARRGSAGDCYVATAHGRYLNRPSCTLVAMIFCMN